MSTTESGTLNPPEHDNLVVFHCWLTREGRISVAGDPRDITDGNVNFLNAME
jgi:hypothetical protein